MENESIVLTQEYKHDDMKAIHDVIMLTTI